MGSKKCNRCGEVKPLVQFNRRAASPDGRQGHCRACNQQNMREWPSRAEQRQAERMEKRASVAPPKPPRPGKEPDERMGKTLVVKEEYLEICGGDLQASLLLDLIVTRSRGGVLPVQRTVRELATDLRIAKATETTIRLRLARLRDAGLILEGADLLPNMDRIRARVSDLDFELLDELEVV